MWHLTLQGFRVYGYILMLDWYHLVLISLDYRCWGFYVLVGYEHMGIFSFLISFGSINSARTFIPRSNQLVIIVVLGRYYPKHQLVYTKVLSCCDINIWSVLQCWYWSGRFFYIIINMMDWYHAFTYIPVQHWYTSRTTPMSDLNGTSNPWKLSKKRCQ